jgi:glucose-6-phosphate isomerase
MNRLLYDYKNLMNNGKIRKGVSLEELLSKSDNAAAAHAKIMEMREKDVLGFYESSLADITGIVKHASELRERFDYFVVLGIGGSALGNKALYSALKNAKSLSKKIITLDNVDPHLIYETLNQIDLEKTVFNVITKSGTTAETMAVFLFFLDLLKKKFPDSYKDHLIVTTDKNKGFLRQYVNNEGIRSYPVPENVGGRFSVLTPVGLLSSAFCGIDIEKLLAGAEEMKNRCENPDFIVNPAYLNGLYHYLLCRKGFHISVMMPYSNDLYDLADWYRQLWAESLGKNRDLEGKKVAVGQTPVKALGATDQHSQIQLYAEGPNDKVLTFLSVKSFSHDYSVPAVFPEEKDIAYIYNKNLSNLLNNEKLATEIALYDAGRPNCTIEFPCLDEYSLGQFIMMYQIQTVFTGYLFNINPLDQPGVEAGKVATRALMGNKESDEVEANIQKYLTDKKNQGAQL